MLVQERRNSRALALELRLPCTNPSILILCRMIFLFILLSMWVNYKKLRNTNMTYAEIRFHVCGMIKEIHHVDIVNCMVSREKNANFATTQGARVHKFSGSASGKLFERQLPVYYYEKDQHHNKSIIHIRKLVWCGHLNPINSILHTTFHNYLN